MPHSLGTALIRIVRADAYGRSHETADGFRHPPAPGDRYRGSPANGRRIGPGFGCTCRSLSDFGKRRLKNVARLIHKCRMSVADEACRRGLDGMVCGHIHHAAVHSIGGIACFDSGDRIESCTILVGDVTAKTGIVRRTKGRDEARPSTRLEVAA